MAQWNSNSLSWKSGKWKVLFVFKEEEEEKKTKTKKKKNNEYTQI